MERIAAWSFVEKTQIFKTLFFAFIVLHSAVYAEDFRMTKTTMKVGANAELLLSKNISISESSMIWNNGTVFLKNSNVAEHSINTILDGDGVYNFIGTADCIVRGEGAAISKLNINTDKTLIIRSDLFISDLLNLENGMIITEEGTKLVVQNSSPESIVFSDNATNRSFIVGTLSRNTIPEMRYSFPVGSVEKGPHSFYVENVSSAGYITLTYLPEFSKAPDTYSTNVSLVDIGGWKVETDSKSIVFTPGISLYNSTGTLTGIYNLFHTPDENNLQNFVVDNNSFIKSGNELTTSGKYGIGVFAVSETLKEEDGTPKLVNFLVSSGSGKSTFEIPSIKDYNKVELLVYNRFGLLVYKSNAYSNDFDSKNYRAGTYYYELVMETLEGKKILKRSFFEIWR